MINVAAMSVQYWQYSFEYFLDSMVKCGIENIELWAGEPHYYRYNYNSAGDAARRVREMRRQMDDRGLKVVMYTPETLGYPFSAASPLPEARNRVVDFYKMCMDDMAGFGTDQLFCNPGWAPRDIPVADSWRRSVDLFKIVGEYAEKMGVTLNIEQLQPYESNLVNTAAQLRRFIDDVASPAMVCCLDIGAMAVAGDTIEDFYREMPGKIRHVHFSDRNHEVPGDQDLPLASYITEFEAKGYDGYLTLEVNDGIYVEDPHAAFARSAEYMRGLLG